MGRLGLALSVFVISACTIGHPELPKGAISVGEDLYMVPVDVNGGNCQPYRMYSPTLVTTMAIYYRKPNGSFTLEKPKSDCR